MEQKPGTPLLAKALPFGSDADIAFAEPWEAKAFAIVVKLAEAGHFTWPEWVECFSKVPVSGRLKAAFQLAAEQP